MRSDLDFLVEYPPAYEFGPWLAKYLELKAELEGLFQRSVDLVMASAPQDPYFLREIDRTRKPLLCSLNGDVRSTGIAVPVLRSLPRQAGPVGHPRGVP